MFQTADLSKVASLRALAVIAVAMAALVATGCSEPYVGVDAPPAGSEATMVDQVSVTGENGIEHIEVNFDEAVRSPGKLVIVDFWAHWCGPCRMLAPELEKIAEQRDDVVVLKVNLDSSPVLSQHFGVGSIPDIRFFRDGKAVGGVVGFRSADELLEELPL